MGVNRFQSDDQPIELLQVDQTAGRKQREKLAQLRKTRDNNAVSQSLSNLAGAAEKPSTNTMPYLIDCVRAHVTLGEICDALRTVFGTYTETNHI